MRFGGGRDMEKNIGANILAKSSAEGCSLWCLCARRVFKARLLPGRAVKR